MNGSFRTSCVVVTLILAACSSSSTGGETDAGNTGDGAPGPLDGGTKQDSGPSDGGSSTGCTITAVGNDSGDTLSFSCHVSASENSNQTTVGINGTDTSGHVFEDEIEFSGDLAVTTYTNANISATSSGLTANGGTTEWNETSSTSGNALGEFTSLVITSTGTEHDLSGSKQWINFDGTYTGVLNLAVGDAGASSYNVTVTF